jgi:hypothetical protein
MTSDRPHRLHPNLPDGPGLGVPDGSGLYELGAGDPGAEELLELLTQLLADLDAAAPDSPDLDALWDRIDRNLP